MGRFQYRALTPQGDVVEDVMDAPSRDTVLARLRDADRLPITVVTVDSADGAAEAIGGERPSTRSRERGRRGRRGRVSPDVLAIFTRQLATLLDAGVSLPEALSIIVDAAASEAIGAIAGRLRRQVREGTVLSEAMSAYPETFDSFYRAMVHAGEGGGALGDSLARLAGYLERATQLRAAIRSALVYPSILVTAALVSVIVLMTVVLPQFEALFRGAASELPWLTKAIFSTAAFVRNEGLILALCIVALVIVFRLRIRKAGARRRLDRFVLRLPLAGRLVQMIEFERIVRSLAALIGNGVGLPQALDLSAAVARNNAMASAVDTANARIKQGDRLADALAHQDVVPNLAVHLIRVGEESGELETMLHKLADIYAREVETVLKRLVAVIEPSLIVCIGVFVGIIVISLLSAIVGINALAS